MTAKRMIELAGSVEHACELRAVDLRRLEGIGASRAETVARSIADAKSEAQREIERCQKLGVRIISQACEAYPALLLAIPDPPLVLYALGDLQPRDLNAIAIVGSRKCSIYGKEQGERFAGLLASAGFTIVSGGARGIDSAAHHGALVQSQGRTVAVLGSAVDQLYPPENEGLFKRIAERGAVLSEFCLGTPPVADHFPRRNRIVSGMSRGVLVIEADVRSGALITARQAADDHGRPVFALPGRVDNPLSAGPHKLLRDGAILTASLEDVLDGLEPLPDVVRQDNLFSDVETSEAEIAQLDTSQESSPADLAPPQSARQPQPCLLYTSPSPRDRG
jgi:DNA processing protein